MREKRRRKEWLLSKGAVVSIESTESKQTNHVDISLLLQTNLGIILLTIDNLMIRWLKYNIFFSSFVVGPTFISIDMTVSFFLGRKKKKCVQKQLCAWLHDQHCFINFISCQAGLLQLIRINIIISIRKPRCGIPHIFRILLHSC